MQRLAGERVLAQSSNRTIVHFLHIGKTGGTAVNNAMGRHSNVTDKFIVVRKHEHDVHFNHIPVGEKIAFFVRDPVARFISAFYFRLSKGKGRLGRGFEWNRIEKRSFSIFKTANELATTLSSQNKK